LSRTPGTASSEAPVPGTHSKEIFSSLGMSDAEIERLTSEGAIG
jgi:crotonobetainyl-CoA:carnitine CoA-transferase CaiB-like acyl-CoA transferase